jgi:hypothetical protein
MLTLRGGKGIAGGEHWAGSRSVSRLKSGLFLSLNLMPKKIGHYSDGHALLSQRSYGAGRLSLE